MACGRGCQHAIVELRVGPEKRTNVIGVFTLPEGAQATHNVGQASVTKHLISDVIVKTIAWLEHFLSWVVTERGRAAVSNVPFFCDALVAELSDTWR